ncbi:MAG: ATP-binding protein [Smithella sp.]|jgi:two-component system sensor histidine kinase BaeS
MKMSITSRLFFLILCATGLAIIFLLLIMWWNINRGFYQYLGTIEQKKLVQVVDDLGKKYEQQGNWGFLKHTPPRWNSDDVIPFSEPEMDRLPLFAPDKKGYNHNPPMGPQFNGNHPLGPPNPFVILSIDKKPIYGFYPPNEKINLHSIIVHGRIVGYVGILSPKRFPRPMQVRFLSQQKLALVLGAVGVVLIVIIISFPLARRMVKPIRAMTAATHDISSGKYTTRISISSTDELGQLARDFNAMALTLEKHEKERRQWVADISHELRTPVTVLQGEIEALMDGIRSVTPETICSLHAEILRLKRLVEDLYQLSLSDLGALNYHKENLDLAEALRNSIKSYRAEFDRKGIALKEINNTKAVCFADRERLRQLFANLLENSLRYTDVGGVLEIVVKISGDFIMIEFQDSKPGVSAGELEKLFDRFYRVEGSRNRESGGAGLGLSIIKEIVEAHEGVISAHSSPLGGLLIRISIPVFGGHK